MKKEIILSKHTNTKTLNKLAPFQVELEENPCPTTITKIRRKEIFEGRTVYGFWIELPKTIQLKGNSDEKRR